MSQCGGNSLTAGLGGVRQHLLAGRKVGVFTSMTLPIISNDRCTEPTQRASATQIGRV